MNSVDIIAGFMFLVFMLVGFYLSYLYGRKTRQFRWSEYAAMLILPIFIVIGYAIWVDIKILGLFVVSAFGGFFLEYVVGLTYHKTLNRRLWTYDKYNIHGYTSLLVIPLWGVAGVFFWFLSRMIGL